MPTGSFEIASIAVLRQDAQLTLAEDVREAGIGDVEREAHGRRIWRLDLLDHRQVGPRPRTRRRVEDAVHGGEHVLGVEGLAVVEFDALAQLEGPGLEVLGGRPAHREVGLDGEVAVDASEAVEDEMDVDVLVADGRLRGVELVERGADRDADGALRERGRRKPGRHGQRENEASHAAPPC